jgi:hypothetical protein
MCLCELIKKDIRFEDNLCRENRILLMINLNLVEKLKCRNGKISKEK